MPDDDSAPPTEGSDGGNEAEEAAWEMATAETLRARGELAEAAMWYRRAANHLMDAGEDERAITVAKLAAELAALDDAGKPSIRAAAAQRNSTQVEDEHPTRVLERSGDLLRSVEQLPWQRQGTEAPPARTGERKLPPIPPSAKSIAAPPNRAGPAAAATEDARKPAATSAAAPRSNTGRVSARSGGNSSRGTATRASAAGARTRRRTDPGDDNEQTGRVNPAVELEAAAKRPSVSAGASSIAAMVDEAMSGIEPAQSTPLSPSASRSRSQQAPVYSPARAGEADRIAACLPALPLFGDLAPERLRDLARQGSIARYQAGEFLCESGAPEGPMFVLIDGAAWVGLIGEESPTAIVGAGDFVGEISALYGGPRTATVQAQGHVEAVVLAPSLVRGLAKDSPPFREALEASIRERLAESLPHLVPMFRRFEAALRTDIFKKFDIIAVPEGAQILSEGEPADALCIVAAGEAEIYGGNFSATRTHRARVGEALGIGSVLTNEPAFASARALRAMLIARMPRSRFREALARHPEIADIAGDIGAPGRAVLF